MLRSLVIAVCFCLAVPAQNQPDDKTRYERIAATGKLWTFVKYFHPQVASEAVDWDGALTTAIGKIGLSTTQEQFEAAVAEMLGVLKDPATKLVSGEDAEVSSSDKEPPKLENLSDGVQILRMGSADFYTATNGLQKLRAEIVGPTVIVDLRGCPMAQYLFSSFPVRKEVETPASYSRVHSGYQHSDNAGYSGYRSTIELQPSQRFRPTPNVKGVRAVFLVDKRSGVPPVAIAMQQAGEAVVLSEDGLDAAQAGVSEVVLLLEKVKAQVRVRELAGGFAENRVLGTTGDASLQEAISVARLEKWGPPSLQSFNAPKPYFAEKGYGNTPYPDASMRMLAAIRVWGVFNYFFPYKHLIGEDWDQVLVEFLPKVDKAADTHSYHLAIAAMVARTNDTHCFISSSELSRFYGTTPPPVEIQWIDDRPMVVRLATDEARQMGFEVGDVIAKISGRPIQERIDELATHVAASTPQSKMSRVTGALLNGEDGSYVDVTVRGVDGKERDLRVRRSSSNWQKLRPSRTGDVYRLINDSIGYADLERLPLAKVDEMFEKFRNTRAIILDMRGYPQGTAWAIAPRLGEKKSPVAAEFRRNLVSAIGSESGHVNTFLFRQQVPPASPNKWRYQGKIVMLIDERAISQSEHSGLFYKAAQDTVFIGSPTAGANGDITWLSVPGGIRVNFSGHDVRWPDGKQLQRVGLIPDIEVRPTTQGIRAGRDEVLDKALEYLSRAVK